MANIEVITQINDLLDADTTALAKTALGVLGAATTGNASIVAADLAPNAVTDVKILDGAVTAGKIGALAVTSGKLAVGAAVANIVDNTLPVAKITGLGTAATAASTDFADDGGVFYATRYGVTADGTTDDRIALQTCILAASAVATSTARATVILPAGTIIVSRGTAVGGGAVPEGGIPNPDGGGYWKFCILLKNNVNVIGQGIDATIIKIKTGVVAETSCLFADDLAIGYGGTGFAENITLKDFTVSGNATARAVDSEGECINIKTAKKLWIENVRVWNAENDGFDIDGGSDITLINVIAEDCNGCGVHIVSGGADKVIISNSVFRRNGFVRRVISGVPSGNYGENGSGVDLATSNCVVSNCLFENNAVELQALSGYTLMEGCVVTHTPATLTLAGIVAGWGWSGATPVSVGSLEIRNCKITSGSTTKSIEIIDNWPLTVIEGCEIRGDIVCTSGKDLIVTGCYVSGSSGKTGIDLVLQTGVATIMNNVLKDSGNHIVIRNSNDGKIMGNTFSGANIDVQFFTSTSDNWEVVGNIFDTAAATRSVHIAPGCSGGLFANNVGNAGGFKFYLGFAGSATNHTLLNNVISTLTVEGGVSTGNLFERNIILTSITATSVVTYSGNTWRGNTGAGCAGIFYGTATLVSGTATVTTAAANSSRKWSLTRQAPNASTAIGNLALGTVTAQTSFVVNALSDIAIVATGDLSTVYWEILE